MNTSPERKRNSFNSLLDNNKFVLVLSLFIAFIIWVMVAMYKSPEESYTIYNVPITIDTENSIVSQRGYKTFWQSNESVDVTVTGPRYLVTAVTAEDILVSANLNYVDSAGISDLELRVSLRENSQDITISGVSQTNIEVYFDTELEKDFSVELEDDVIPEHIAEGYQLSSAELTVTSVKLRGPETEINKIRRVVANPRLPEELMYITNTVEADISLEGASAAETVSVNKYVEIIDIQEYFTKISIDRMAELKPAVEFTGTREGNVSVDFNTDVIFAKIDTEIGYDSDVLNLLTLDYSELNVGANFYNVKMSDVEMPDGVTAMDSTFTFNITIIVTE